jgi:hypothetical protein
MDNDKDKNVTRSINERPVISIDKNATRNISIDIDKGKNVTESKNVTKNATKIDDKAVNITKKVIKIKSDCRLGEDELFQYPFLAKGNTTENYTTADNKTVSIADPYRILEDSEANETKKWIKA